MLAKFRVETTIIVSIAGFLVVLLTVQLFFLYGFYFRKLKCIRKFLHYNTTCIMYVCMLFCMKIKSKHKFKVRNIKILLSCLKLPSMRYFRSLVIFYGQVNTVKPVTSEPTVVLQS